MEEDDVLAAPRSLSKELLAEIFLGVPLTIYRPASHNYPSYNYNLFPSPVQISDKLYKLIQLSESIQNLSLFVNDFPHGIPVNHRTTQIRTKHSLLCKLVGELECRKKIEDYANAHTTVQTANELREEIECLLMEETYSKVSLKFLRAVPIQLPNKVVLIGHLQTMIDEERQRLLDAEKKANSDVWKELENRKAGTKLREGIQFSGITLFPLSSYEIAAKDKFLKKV